MAQLFDQLDAVAVRKKPIEDNNVVFLCHRKAQPCGPIGSNVYRMTLVRQVISNERSIAIIVFDDQDFH
jgi:hypothetical protein